ncbi:hypothetical protein L1987_58493 [Smallanthus sonchifolius]|uniref:Uncharacterized protein n=1 Tax=Smallanthus sonchifolius TaxID=185202 RepID=A0ACB9DFR9_9ASTR|nr:hypothetical protein L1987_58493 [Smallanthus sonchifolius]
MASDDHYMLTYQRTPNRKKDGKSNVSSSSKKGKRKSYRISLRTTFSKFTNDQETPIILDEEEIEEMEHPAGEVNEPPRKKLKLKLKMAVVEEESEICLPTSKKLKLKLPKAVSKKTPKTSIQVEFTSGKKAEKQPKEKDDDDFVTPPPPKIISKTPQLKRTYKEISRSKSGKQPEAQVENQYYEFTGKKILPRIDASNLMNWFATFKDDQKRTINEMGFEPVLNLKLDLILAELAFWMVQNYNAEVVHKVMGIPLGTIPIQEKRPSGKDAVVAKWRSFYKNTTWIKRPFVLGFFRRVGEMQESERKFILNFFGWIFHCFWGNQ